MIKKLQIKHNNKVNKKANTYAIILYFVALFLILFVGFIMIVGSSVLNWTFDEVVPELNDLGMLGDFNATQTAGFTIDSVNGIVQSFVWLSGILYMFLLIASFGIVMIVRQTPNKFLIGFYFLLAIMLVVGCILMSNIYEDFSNDSSELGSLLREHTVLNFMILYSPGIFSVIVFATGIVLFSGLANEEGF